MGSSLEPQVGDIIEITYDGEILETHLARLSKIYNIKVVEKAMSVTDEEQSKSSPATEVWDMTPMVMVDGNSISYYRIRKHCNKKCGVMDGEITFPVAGNEIPTISTEQLKEPSKSI